MSNLPLRHLAILSETPELAMPELNRVSAALQTQVLRDVAPLWECHATVNAFSALADVPLGAWPVIIRNDIHQTGAAGIHSDNNGQPFALVQYTPHWSLTASHEVIEMLCDPSGNRIKSGKSPMPEQGEVAFLVEVCDPSEAYEFGYAIHGIAVSDFYTPHYFDPVHSPGVRYSFTGAINKPLDVLPGGYLSWHDPVSDHWHQETYFDEKRNFRDLGRIDQQSSNIRSFIYRETAAAAAPARRAGLRNYGCRQGTTIRHNLPARPKRVH